MPLVGTTLMIGGAKATTDRRGCFGVRTKLGAAPIEVEISGRTMAGRSHELDTSFPARSIPGCGSRWIFQIVGALQRPCDARCKRRTPTIRRHHGSLARSRIASHLAAWSEYAAWRELVEQAQDQPSMPDSIMPNGIRMAPALASLCVRVDQPTRGFRAKSRNE